MPISKTFEFYEIFNYSILKIKESGILQYIDKTYQEKYGGIHRACDSPSVPKGTAISLHTVVSAVAVLLAGICAGILLVLLEMCWGCMQVRQRIDKNKIRFFRRRHNREEPDS